MSLRLGPNIHQTPPAMEFLQILSPLSRKISQPSHCLINPLQVPNSILQRSLPVALPHRARAL